MWSALQSSHQYSSGLLGRKHLARGKERVFNGRTWCLQGALYKESKGFDLGLWSPLYHWLAMWPWESCSIPLIRTKSFVCRCMGVHFLKTFSTDIIPLRVIQIWLPVILGLEVGPDDTSSEGNNVCKTIALSPRSWWIRWTYTKRSKSIHFLMGLSTQIWGSENEALP